MGVVSRVAVLLFLALLSLSITGASESGQGGSGTGGPDGGGGRGGLNISSGGWGGYNDSGRGLNDSGRGLNDSGRGLNDTKRAGEADPKEDDHECRLFRFLLYFVAMGLLSLVGFAGNTVSFLVLNKDKSTPVASFLLQSLAVADNIFLGLWLVHYSVRDVFRYLAIEQRKHVTWMYLRVYSFPVLYMAQTQTIWLTVVIALNRFMAVCLPYRAPHLCNINNVYKEVGVVTLFSVIYNLPRFFELEIHSTEDFASVWNRTAFGANTVYQTVYVDALYYLFSFILPLLILAFVNTRVIIAYRATRQRRQRMMSSMSTRRQESENNITLVMIMVVLIFMLCQAPARIVQLVWSYVYQSCRDYQYYMIHISNTLEVLNSSVNFLIYCIFHKRFRDIMQQHFCCGPLATRGRRNSTRFTTTEGLSLEEVQKTTPGSSKGKGSSIKSISQENKNGVVPNAAQCDGPANNCVAYNPVAQVAPSAGTSAASGVAGAAGVSPGGARGGMTEATVSAAAIIDMTADGELRQPLTGGGDSTAEERAEALDLRAGEEEEEEEDEEEEEEEEEEEDGDGSSGTREVEVGIYKTEEVPLEENSTEPQDDVLVPLHP